MIPADVKVWAEAGRIGIYPASGVSAQTLDAIRDNKLTAIRLIEAGPEFDPVVLLNEFMGDLEDVAHCTDQQLRQAVEIAARWHGWRRYADKAALRTGAAACAARMSV